MLMVSCLALATCQELRLFMSVMGVGEQTAKHWVAQNCYTLEDVRRRQQDLGLTQGQKVSGAASALHSAGRGV